MADVSDKPIYLALEAIKPTRFKTMAAWATAAGLARNAFSYIREHGNPKPDTLQKLLDLTDVSLSEFYARVEPVKTEVRSAGAVGVGEVSRAFFGEDPLPRLPLLGTAVGGECGDVDDDVEMTELHLGEVLEYLSRPTSLANDRDAYALTIVGDSMVPRFRPGERVAVSPKSPVGIGDDVIVQLRCADGDDERIKMVLIKELVRRTATHVELRQYNPEKVFRVEAKRVAAMHKVRGNFF